jgi:hypothetical protein
MTVGQKASKKTKTPPFLEKEKEEHATIPARLCPTTHQYIISQANWGESIDKTLQRLLKIPQNTKKGANGK